MVVAEEIFTRVTRQENDNQDVLFDNRFVRTS